MAYDVISVDYRIKKKLGILKGRKSWSEFFEQDVLPRLEEKHGR